MIKLVLLRHGESTWNMENIFTGWVDVGLSKRGEEESREAGRMLKQAGFVFDIVYTSVLERAVRTAELTLRELGQPSIPLEKSWRLNERHYGALQGMNKAEVAKEHGEEQVRIWRRSYDIAPPAMDESNKYYAGRDPKYKALKKSEIPLTESLKDTVERVLPYWHATLAPALKSGRRVLVVAHGNSLRALVKYLDGMSDDAVVRLNIPTGIPLVYELDDDLKPVKHYYLGDQEKAGQGKRKK